MNASVQHPNHKIRRIDLKRDLWDAADLIEMCFKEHLDSDGKRYVSHIRQAATYQHLIRWTRGASERIAYPLHGFVCEENKRVVANLSYIPYHYKGKWFYLIANVAVHPDYRRRGIARAMTNTALDHIRSKGVPVVWLHVRESNQAALDLYNSLGFVERTRRTDWLAAPEDPLPDSSPAGVSVRRRHNADWKQERLWLSATYPPEVLWYLPVDLDQFNPSLVSRLWYVLTPSGMRHWSAVAGSSLLGSVAWSGNPRRFSDYLWLALDPERENLAIQALLPHVRKRKGGRRPLIVNFPAGRSENAFRVAGFSIHNTLVWMELRFDHNR